MFKRAQFKELEARLLEPRNKIQIVSGPRQVGKSTLLVIEQWYHNNHRDGDDQIFRPYCF